MSVAMWPSGVLVNDSSSFQLGSSDDKTTTAKPFSRPKIAEPYRTVQPSAVQPNEQRAFVRRLDEIVSDFDEEDRQNATFLHNFLSSVNRLYSYQELSHYLDRVRIYGNEEGGLNLIWKKGRFQVHLVIDGGRPDQDYIYVLDEPPGKVLASPGLYLLRKKLEWLDAQPSEE